jgi:hypothetical protein
MHSSSNQYAKDLDLILADISRWSRRELSGPSYRDFHAGHDDNFSLPYSPHHHVDVEEIQA